MSDAPPVCLSCPTHLAVSEALSVNQKGVASQQVASQQPAHANSAQAAVQRQPAATRLVSGHHHRFDAHHEAVTAAETEPGSVSSRFRLLNYTSGY